MNILALPLSLKAAVVATMLAAISLSVTGCATSSSVDKNVGPTPTLTSNGKHRTIIFVWDGLRPDSIDATNTPTLYNLSKNGSYFSDNHSTYPTYTMANGASFATGASLEPPASTATTLMPVPPPVSPQPPVPPLPVRQSTSTSRSLRKTGASSTT